MAKKTKSTSQDPETRVLQRAAALAARRKETGKGKVGGDHYESILESSRLLTEAESRRVAGALKTMVNTVYWPALRDLAKIRKVQLGLEAADAAGTGEAKAKIAFMGGIVHGMFYLLDEAEELVRSLQPPEDEQTPGRVDRIIKRGMGGGEPGGADF